VVQVFPILSDRLKETAGRFSGGQQRQLSIAMALMTNPRLMLLDEPSLGISPSVVQKTFQVIRDLSRERNSSVLVVEQNVKAMTKIADRIYVLRNGQVVLEESREQALARTDWWSLF
jgi:branched-chain amino acid transport system ATP-binding protein